VLGAITKRRVLVVDVRRGDGFGQDDCGLGNDEKIASSAQAERSVAAPEMCTLACNTPKTA